MVREVQLSWDDELPYPVELEQNHWDAEENTLDDLGALSQVGRRKEARDNNGTQKRNRNSEVSD